MSATSNSTHRKRLARRLAEATGMPYSTCLDEVRRAADAGVLPARLDQDGMREALRVLLAAQTASADEPGRTDVSPSATERLYLVRPHLAVLRQVWQGRVSKDRVESRTGVSAQWRVDNNPASASTETILVLLERDGYIVAALPEVDEWVVARLTDFGDEVLAANGGDGDKFRDGLPAPRPQGVAAAAHREPYVGGGADGARRSARIDREEADGLDRDAPRREECLASARRWDAQADALDRVIGTSDRLAPIARSDDPVGEALRLAPVRDGRRVASDSRDQAIWDASWAYEFLTGRQGLLYISAPGQGADRYVFGAGHTALGREEALTHVLGLLEEVRANPSRVTEWLHDPARPRENAEPPAAERPPARIRPWERRMRLVRDTVHHILETEAHYPDTMAVIERVNETSAARDPRYRRMGLGIALRDYLNVVDNDSFLRTSVCTQCRAILRPARTEAFPEGAFAAVGLAPCPEADGSERDDGVRVDGGHRMGGLSKIARVDVGEGAILAALGPRG